MGAADTVPVEYLHMYVLMQHAVRQLPAGLNRTNSYEYLEINETGHQFDSIEYCILSVPGYHNEYIESESWNDNLIETTYDINLSSEYIPSRISVNNRILLQ